MAILFAEKKPEGALHFKEGRWGCVVAMFTAAAKGRTAVFDRQTFGCLGGGTGLGFGNQYVHFPGGIEYFLSTGNKNLPCLQMRRTSGLRPSLKKGKGISSPRKSPKSLSTPCP
ncbi:MAG: DUF169 domain-containing protein [Bacillota bacterium]